MTISGQAAPGPLPWREMGMEVTAPYPTEGVMPPTPGLDNKIRNMLEDERTVVPAAVSAYYEPVDEQPLDEVDQAALTPIVETPSVYTALDGLEIPTPALETGIFEEWNAVIPNHRVIKKQEARRYRDRAGSWRDVRTVGDPRVGVTLDVAVGSLAGKPATGAGAGVVPVWPPHRKRRVTAQTQSEAQLELNKIRQRAAGKQAIAQAQAQAQLINEGGSGGLDEWWGIAHCKRSFSSYAVIKWVAFSEWMAEEVEGGLWLECAECSNGGWFDIAEHATWSAAFSISTAGG
ncbi:hypothetical protein N0V85_009326 [Neurospora sp. IMI 360204]|nr:hypothetical protein N0V85_009326 [Neurospora sp. IMI 360204]